MATQMHCFTVVCKHHYDIDACDPWGEFVVIVNDAAEASQAAIAACKRLVRDHGGRASATMVISGKPDLSFPEVFYSDSDVEGESERDGLIVSSYRNLS